MSGNYIQLIQMAWMKGGKGEEKTKEIVEASGVREFEVSSRRYALLHYGLALSRREITIGVEMCTG